MKKRLTLSLLVSLASFNLSACTIFEQIQELVTPVTTPIPMVSPVKKTQLRELFPVKQNDKYGYVNKSGDLIIPASFDEAKDFFQNLASVKQGETWGFIDNTGRLVIPAVYEKFAHFSEGLAGVKKTGEKYGFIDRQGKIVVEPQFDEVRNFSEGLAAVKKDGAWGFIDKSGNMVIDPEFRIGAGRGFFVSGLAAVQREDGSKYGYIDKTGKFVI
ncbi:MAG: WG repeat-containing protein, partial [Microcoleaceae cyanobacterium]